jgi:hypothetical protein
VKKTTKTFSFAAAAVLLAASASAEFKKDALGAIAVSPDGATVVAAGDNRVLYVLDPATLEVKSRTSIDTNPLEMAFSKDGSTLAMFTVDDELRFYKTADWSLISVAQDVTRISFAAAADSVATLGNAGWGDDATTPLAVYALTGGSPTLQAVVKGNIKTVSVSPDASQFVLVTEPKDDAGEAKNDTPSNLQDFARTEFTQKNDGRTSEIVLLDKSGAETKREKTFFSSYQMMATAISGDSAYFLTYADSNLKVTLSDLSSTAFDSKQWYLTGAASSPDQSVVVSGVEREGVVRTLSSGNSAPFKIDDQPGASEYFEGFAFGPDGTIFGGTSSYRLVKLSPSGQVQLTKPIF